MVVRKPLPSGGAFLFGGGDPGCEGPGAPGAQATANAKATARATARANTGVLHCVQDDESMGDVEENGRALLDTPPFAKCAKGGAPRIGVSEERCGSVKTPISKCERSGSSELRFGAG